MQEVKINLYECHDRLVNELDTQFDSTSHLQVVSPGLSSQVIVENIEGELERKFKILDSKYSAHLDASRLLLEVLRLRDFF